jgi:L-iditol 2-dehydrogenase
MAVVGIALLTGSPCPVPSHPRAIAIIEAGLVEVSSLVSHRFAIAEFEAAFRTAVRRDGLKVVVTPAA